MDIWDFEYHILHYWIIYNNLCNQMPSRDSNVYFIETSEVYKNYLPSLFTCPGFDLFDYNHITHGTYIKW